MSGIAMAAVSIGLTAYGMYEKKKAGDQAAATDTAVADYNARTDIAAAQQLDLDTVQNVRTARQNDAVYLSRQEASYAAAGVLATSGSPMQARITTAGRMEQQIQQMWVNSQQAQAKQYAAAKVGRLEGAARAESDRLSGTIALINGASKIAGDVYGVYKDGTFRKGGSGDEAIMSGEAGGRW